MRILIALLLLSPALALHAESGETPLINQLQMLADVDPIAMPSIKGKPVDLPSDQSPAHALVSNPTKNRVRPTRDAVCILKAILFGMEITYDPGKALPKIRLASEVPVKEFDAAMEPQWGFKPGKVTNAYAPHVRTIFINDEADYYLKTGRSIDGSLAHELTHYVQVRYFGIQIKEFLDGEEMQAVHMQTWFRDNYINGNPPPGAPACPKKG